MAATSGSDRSNAREPAWTNRGSRAATRREYAVDAVFAKRDGRSPAPMTVTPGGTVTLLSTWAVSTVDPPGSAVVSTMTDPGRIAATVSAVTRTSGAAVAGCRPVTTT